MIQWSAFYQMLDIASDIDTPTYYDLLAIQPGSATKERVKQALKDRKNLLRQRVRDPRMMPLIQKFEENQLIPAANTLSDPLKREAYDKKLPVLEKNKRSLSHHAKKNELIKQAKSIIEQQMNDDHTLDRKKRPKLKIQLHDMGLAADDICKLLDTIAEPGQDAIAHDDSGEIFRNIIQDLTPDEDLSQLKNRETVPPSQMFFILKYVLLPLTGIATLFFIFMMVINLPDREEPVTIPYLETPDTPAAKKQDTAATETDSTTSQDDQNKGPLFIKRRPSRTNNNVTGRYSGTLTDQAELIHQSFTDQQDNAYLLCDIAMTQLTAFDLALKTFNSPDTASEEIDYILSIETHEERIEWLTRNVRLTLSPIPLINLKTPEELDELRQLRDIVFNSKNRGEVYRAIEKLRLDNTTEAVLILIERLKERDLPDERTINRILHALKRMKEPHIPVQLVQLLTDAPRKSLVRPIVLALIELNHFEMQTQKDSYAVLPYQYNRQQLDKCIEWWETFYTLNPPTLAPHSENNLALNRTEEKTLKLLATITEINNSLADMMRTVQWDNQKTSLPPAKLKTISVNTQTGQQLIESLKRLTQYTIRLTRTFPGSTEYADQIDQIELKCQTEILLSDQIMDTVLIYNEAIGSLMDIVARQKNNTAANLAKLDELMKERTEEVNQYRRKNLLMAIRESAFYNVRLWELMSL